MNKERIRAKAFLGLPLTAKEMAVYLLFIASTAAAKEILQDLNVNLLLLNNKPTVGGYSDGKEYEK